MLRDTEIGSLQLAYKLAMRIFREWNFSKEDGTLVTDQIRRSSRSVPSNIGKGRRDATQNMFHQQLADSDGEASETQVGSIFARLRYLAQNLTTN